MGGGRGRWGLAPSLGALPRSRGWQGQAPRLRFPAPGQGLFTVETQA